MSIETKVRLAMLLLALLAIPLTVVVAPFLPG